MDRMVFTAASGAARTLEHETVVNNNLANANTDGFRAEVAHYRSVPVDGAGLPTRVSTVTATPGADFSPGVLHQTGRPLDLAIRGRGWFVVRDAAGNEAYTRAGSMQVDADGVLRNAQGHVVLSAADDEIIVPRNTQITVAPNGTISAVGAGDTPTDIAVIGELKRVNPPERDLERGDDGLFRLRAGAQPQPPLASDATVGVASGMVEMSNVSPARVMVDMINNTRRFEMEMGVVKHADTNEQSANALLGTD